MNETQQRFLRAVLERIPVDRIVDAYVFPPMKQGGQETGIAIVAARRELPPAPEAEPPAAEEPPPLELFEAPACDPTEVASLDAPAGEEAATGDAPADAPADGAAHAAREVHEGSAADAPAPVPDAVPDAVPAPAASTRERHTVYTARYRLTLKGPERGRWEVDVVEEADAPLLTVEVVVRGVQRRSGEELEPERLGAEALQELVAPRDAA